MWWIKVRRAQNPEDYETWEENQVHPTLSKFDVGDVRTVALVEVQAILLRDRAGKPGGGKGPLLSEELSLTLLNHNEQILFQAIPIQDGRDIEKHQNGLGVGEESDPSYTLDRTGGQSVFAIQNTVIGRKDENGPQGKGYGEETDPMFTIDRSSPHAVAATFGYDEYNDAISEELHNTLRSGTKQSTGVIEPTTVVRRLTPVECERLQGFPDNWTAGQTDSQRYKQMGNAVTVNVVEWVGKAIMGAENYGETFDSQNP